MNDEDEIEVVISDALSPYWCQWNTMNDAPGPIPAVVWPQPPFVLSQRGRWDYWIASGIRDPDTEQRYGMPRQPGLRITIKSGQLDTEPWREWEAMRVVRLTPDQLDTLDKFVRAEYAKRAESGNR